MNIWNINDLAEIFSSSKFQNLLIKGKWGLEKESLRIDREGNLSMTPHPVKFGDKLKNPFITTDYSESQIEIITPPLSSVEETLEYLNKLQINSEFIIGEELLWPLSMPASLPDEEKIPIASYGNSEEGKKKEIYRLGLALRYGKKMQMISGIHYNFSFHSDFWKRLHRETDPSSNFQQFINKSYFSLARNFLRYRWLLIYLFGASPTADQKYLHDIESDFKSLQRVYKLDNKYEMTDNITSIRMSRLGYQNKQQQNFDVSFNNINEYISDLRALMATESLFFRDLGVFKDNKQIQLNSKILQLENEYYSPIRLKQITNNDENQLDALEKKGVEYIEIRAFDLNPFERSGIGIEQLYFMQIFMLFCLFKESPLLDSKETEIIDENSQKVALFGRTPDLKINYPNGEKIPLNSEAKKILSEMQKITPLMDTAVGNKKYTETIMKQIQKTEDHSFLPSQMIISEMINKNESYLQFGLRKSLEYIRFELENCPMKIKVCNSTLCNFEIKENCNVHCKYLQG